MGGLSMSSVLLNILIPILIQIESNGVSNAIGDGGDAVGVLQIHESVILDVNRVNGTGFTLEDRLNPQKSILIARLYLIYWGIQYQKTTNQPPTLEVYARIWNGGPNGWKKTATLDYWLKVKEILEKD